MIISRLIKSPCIRLNRLLLSARTQYTIHISIFDILISLIISVAHCVFILFSDEPNVLQTFLGFVTGLDTIPSLGFDPSPRIRFHHPNQVDLYDGLPYMPYTTACATILTVPALSDYDLFKE